MLRPKDALPAAGAVFIALALLGLAAAPAEAHRLRVFATVEAGAIEGYAFFVGGGRPADAAVRFVRAGEVVHATTTDEAGAFAWRPQDPGAITVVVDPGGGHVAEVTLDAERFGGEANSVPAPAPATGGTTPSGLDPAVEAAIEAAVARQIRPLLEAQAETQSRVRLTDVAGGIGMIVGLTGIALWARTRGSGRRDH